MIMSCYKNSIHSSRVLEKHEGFNRCPEQITPKSAIPQQPGSKSGPRNLNLHRVEQNYTRAQKGVPPSVCTVQTAKFVCWLLNHFVRLLTSTPGHQSPSWRLLWHLICLPFFPLERRTSELKYQRQFHPGSGW